MNAPPTPIRSFTLDNLLLFALGHLATLPSKQVEVASDLPGTTLYGVLFSQLTVDSQIDLRYAVCMSNKRYEFRIPVGDWSDDGHVREAWFKASAEHPDLSPTSFCGSSPRLTTMPKSPSITFFKKRANELEGEECHSHKLHTVALRAGFRKWNDLVAATEDERQASIAIYKSGIKRICVCRHGMSDHGLPDSDAGLPTMADWCQREDCGCEKFRDDRGEDMGADRGRSIW